MCRKQTSAASCALARLKTALTYFLSVHWSSRVDCDGFGRNQRHVCGCFLALDLSRAFLAGGRVEDHFRHFMGDMAPAERDHLQGSSPLHRHGTA